MTTEMSKSEIESAWREHCRSAVRKFVMNAVVVDDKPFLPERNHIVERSAAIAQAVDDGTGSLDGDNEGEILIEEGGPEVDKINGHPLNIQAISDAFADQDIACSFVLPKEQDPEETIIKRVLVAAIPADIVIIDWKLRNSSHSITLNILEQIAQKDAAENGRFRLICIYTGEPQIAEITRDALTALEKGGLVFEQRHEDAGRAMGKYHCLQVLKKDEEPGVDHLPKILVNSMTDLANGLLPAFSLAAVSAIRKNVHHIISRFSSDLDGAYVANRMITSPPGEVAELMRELFISECDTALGLEMVADQFLEPEKIKLWLEDRSQPKTVCEYGKEKAKTKTDRDFLISLLDTGISDGKVLVAKNQVKFPEDKRVLVSQSIHGDEATAIKAENQFAKHVALKREAFGKTKMKSEGGDWVPSLTLGTILRHRKIVDGNPKDTYYYCLTPACDTIRIMGDIRTFLLLEVSEKDKANLILTEEDGADKRLFIDSKPTNIRAFQFKGCVLAGRVKAERRVETEKTTFIFQSATEQVEEFLWLGEVRRNRANRDMANLNREWLRFGIKDSEYLRLAERGSV